MPWKEELPSQGPAPSHGDLRHENRGVTAGSVREMIADRLSAETGSFVSSGNIEVATAPLHRFPWEVRLIGEAYTQQQTDENGDPVVDGNGDPVMVEVSPATIRIYKGLVRYSVGNTLGYEYKNSHIRYTNGKETAPIRIQGSRISSPGDLDWIPSVNQRDPNAVLPEGNGDQVAWPPTFIGGSTDVGAGGSTRDPEPKDGGIVFQTGGDNIGFNDYGAEGANAIPWFETPYVADQPIWLAGRIGLDGNFEFGVFAGDVPAEEPDKKPFKMLIAHVTSMELIHQYLRSDVVFFQLIPTNPLGAPDTTGYHLVKASHDQLDVVWQEWEAPDDGQMYARQNKAWVAFEPGEGGGGGGGDPVYDTHPFRVTAVDIEGSPFFSINPGTVNSDEVVQALPQPASLPAYVYLRVDFAATSPHAITARSIVVDTDNDLHLNSSNFTSYLKIAAILPGGANGYYINQYVTGSLWLDRIQVGNLPARFFYARI